MPSSEPPVRGPGAVRSLSPDRAANSRGKPPQGAPREAPSSFIPPTTPPVCTLSTRQTIRLRSDLGRDGGLPRRYDRRVLSKSLHRWVGRSVRRQSACLLRPAGAGALLEQNSQRQDSEIA